MDTIIFTEKEKALQFYLTALSAGVYARYEGMGITAEGVEFYTVLVYVDITLRLKKEGYLD